MVRVVGRMQMKAMTNTPTNGRGIPHDYGGGEGLRGSKLGSNKSCREERDRTAIN